MKKMTETKAQVGKILQGKVVSTKMKDTVVVSVERFIKHEKYNKFIKITKRFKAHDAGNVSKLGDTVSIVECAPISKSKNFKIVRA